MLADEALIGSPVRQTILRLPEPDRTAYVTALQRAPDVVEKDSPESRFLAVENGNVEKAAKRLASYWDTRKEIFRERAYLPMSLDENGVFTVTEIELFNTGFFTPIPNHPSGRPVGAFDLSRLGAMYSFESFNEVRLRVAFYTFSILAESPVAQSDKILILISLCKSPRRDVMARVMRFARDSLPIRNVEAHVMILPSVADFGQFFQGVVDFFLLMIQPLARSTLVHRGDTDVDVLEKVVDNGFLLDGIPSWMGGNWSVDMFEDWKTRRLSEEQQRYPGLEESCHEVHPTREAIDGNVSKQPSVPIELSLLQEHVATLRADNAALQAENMRLTRLLTLAISVLKPG